MNRHLMTLGEKIRSLRNQRGLTQSELAGPNFTKSFISQIEKNVAKPSLKSLQIIAERLGTSTSDLLDESFSGDPKLEESVREALNAINRDIGTGNFIEALQELEKCEPQANDNPALMSETLTLKARALTHLGRYSEALIVLDDLVSTLDKHQPVNSLATAHNFIGYLHDRLGRPSDSVAEFERALSLLSNSSVIDEFLKTRILVNLGIAHYKTYDQAQAKASLLEALELSREAGGYYKYGEACQTLGVIYYYENDLGKAISYSRRAVQFYKATGHDRNLAMTLANLGEYYHLQNNNDLAREQFEEALRIAEETGLELTLQRCHLHLAEIALEEEDQQTALQHLKSAVTHASSDEEKATTLMRLADVNIGLEEFDCALNYLEEAQSILEDFAPPKQMAEVYSKMGKVAHHLGKAELASEYLLKSVSLYQKDSSPS